MRERWDVHPLWGRLHMYLPLWVYRRFVPDGSDDDNCHCNYDNYHRDNYLRDYYHYDVTQIPFCYALSGTDGTHGGEYASI